MSSSVGKNLRVPVGLWQQLLPFQREGVEYVIKKEGRALIADQMGLGKTVQAIASSLQYRNDWPALVICPSSLRYNWREEYIKWTDIKEDQIAVVMTGKQQCDKLLNIISYDLARAKADELKRQKFNMVIVDESHALKNRKSKRTKALAPLLKKSKRLLLLSGTPALNRVEEIFTQLQVLQPKQWSNFHKFGLRYCNAKHGPFGWDYSGASNLEELFKRMSDTLMVRRHKDQVLKDLPPKRRQRILIQSTPKAQRMIKSFQELLSEQRSTEGSIERSKNDELRRIDNGADDADDKQSRIEKKALSKSRRANYEFKSKFMQLYREVCVVKIPAILSYVQDQLESDTGPFLLFAHHQVVLDAVQQHLDKKKVRFIRIDGNTDPKQRQALVNQFQDANRHVRVALLSITAAGVGLTLTRANLVAFAELFFTPGSLLQAEDRVHRIGQTADFVMIHYLIGEKTVEEVLWRILERKLRELSIMLDGKSEAEANEKQSQWEVEDSTEDRHHLKLLDTRQDDANNSGGDGDMWAEIMMAVHETFRQKKLAADQRKREKAAKKLEQRSEKRKRDQQAALETRMEEQQRKQKMQRREKAKKTIMTEAKGKQPFVVKPAADPPLISESAQVQGIMHVNQLVHEPDKWKWTRRTPIYKPL